MAKESSAWPQLREAVVAFQRLQSADGSVAGDTTRATALIEVVVNAIDELAPEFDHDIAYLQALITDLRHWAGTGFGVPDFGASLAAFQPSADRVDGRRHLVVFPMYTQNGSTERHLEALIIRVVWPQWLADLEASRYDNAMFVPICFEDFTPGYDTHSAVLFPETVSVAQTPPAYSWGAIFCDREAARFRRVTTAAVDLLQIDLPDSVQGLLDDQERTQQAFVLWDLIHDRTHSHGDLPFDPFMIRQRQPFWMYGLEELRCDLTAFSEAVELAAEAPSDSVRAVAEDVQIAVLFDRLFRFPVTGNRVRNYDGLGGQLLFAWLHKNDAVRWTDNTLRIDFEAAVLATRALCAKIETFYRDGIDRPKLVHWLVGHDLVSTYLAPHPGSRWATRDLDFTKLPRELVDDVLPDEFPLSMFYEALSRKLAGVVESTKGITALSA